LGCEEEGVLLPARWEGLPDNTTSTIDNAASSPASAAATTTNDLGAVRLCCWLFQLGGWVVRGEEAVVLPEQEARVRDHAAAHHAGAFGAI
jgi:hypothetical protein